MNSRKLHIGGHIVKEGWEILDGNANQGVDHVGDATDLSRFAEATFEAVYASHVIEHFDYNDKLMATLGEWYRVLKPGGNLYVSAPDLDVLAQLFTMRKQLSVEQRFLIMRMIFGGHIDKWDYHQVGLNQEFLSSYLHATGFIELRRVDSFGLFQDTSEMEFQGIPISVNMIATKPLN